MDQVSRPLQILLVAAVAFGALWMIVLRPKDGGGGSSAPAKPAAQSRPTATSPAQGPGSSIPGGLGRAVTKARGAAGQSDAANQRLDQASNAAGTSGATAAGSTPATRPAPVARPASGPRTSGPRTLAGFTPRLPTNNAAATSVALAAGMLTAGVIEAVGAKLGAASSPVTVVGPRSRAGHVPTPRTSRTPAASTSPAAVNAAMAGGKVVVLLFWNGAASDDRRVHEELSQVSTHGGHVLLVSAPVGQVSRFAGSIRGIQVLQSPTVVVVDRRHQARTLVGFTDRAEIGQAVDSALVGR